MYGITDLYCFNQVYDKGRKLTDLPGMDWEREMWLAFLEHLLALLLVQTLPLEEKLVFDSTVYYRCLS